MRNAYEGQNKGDPHEEVETTKDVVERLLPVLGRWRTDDVLAILDLALNDGVLQAVHGVSGVTSIHLFWGDEVDVDARYSICWIRAGFGLSRQLLFLDTDGKRSITTKKSVETTTTTGRQGKVGVSPDLNSIARDLVPPRGGYPGVRLLEVHEAELEV